MTHHRSQQNTHYRNGMMAAIGLFAALCYTLLLPSTTHAQFNQEINYQGKLNDSAGVPVSDGSYEMHFRLYTVPTGGSDIWDEVVTVTVTDGLFAHLLGSSSTISSVDFNQTLYLGVAVGTDSEMTPRKPLGAVPAAFEALNTQTFDSLATSSFLRSDTDDTATGLLTFTGGFLSQASSTISGLTTTFATTTNLIINNERFTDLTGYGLTTASNQLTVDTTALDNRYASTTTFDTESELETLLTDVSDVFTNNDTIASTSLAAEVLVASEIGTEALLEALLGDVSDVFTNNDTIGVGNGGTGAISLTGLLIGNGTSAFTATTTLASDYIADNYVLNTGDSISGTLTFSGSAANIALGSNYLSGDGGDEGIYVDSNGNVGIGTTSPSALLSVGAGDFEAIDGTDDLYVTDDVEIDDALYVAGAATFDNNARIATMLGTADDNVRIRADQAVIIDLDEDNDGSNSFFIRDGANATIFAINESGQVTTGGWTGTVIDEAYLDTDVTLLGADIGPTELASTDFGDFSCNGTTCSFDADTVGDAEIDFGTGAGQVSLSDFTDDVGYLTDITGSSFLDLSDTPVSFTNTRLLYMSGAAVTSDADLTFDGTTLTVSGDVNIASNTGGLEFFGTRFFYGSSTSNNLAIGDGAGANFTTAVDSIAIGTDALSTATSTPRNVAIGYQALRDARESGDDNVAVGYNALVLNTTGRDNVAVGPNTLDENLTGRNNVAIGSSALHSNTTGDQNVALGQSALANTEDGASNFGMGYQALQLNVSGGNNVGIGYRTLRSATSSYNTAIGRQSGLNVVSGQYNIFLGTNSGNGIITGSNNVIIGGVDGLPSTTADTIILGTGNGTERLRIDSSGNVGIGTTSPNRRLSVAGDAIITGALFDSTDSAGSNGMVLQTTGSGFQWVATSSLGIGEGVGSSLFTDGGATTYLTAVADNLGIGTTTASAKLTVEGNINLSTIDSAIQFDGTDVIRLNPITGTVRLGNLAGNNVTSAMTQNIFIGTRAGQNITNAASDYNVLVGYQAGRNIDGQSNMLFGRQSGMDLVGSYNNLFGYTAGRNLIGSNTNAFGRQAGNSATSSFSNFFGYQAGENVVGDNNNLFGYRAGSYLVGDENIGIGRETLGYATGAQFTADNNLALGYRAGYSIGAGSNNNIFIGYAASDNLTAGSNNIIIGHNIDAASSTGSNQLSIGNLIYGTDIDGTGTTISTGNIGIGTTSPSALLSVGAGDFETIDGTDDLYVTDDVEIDDALFVAGVATFDSNARIATILGATDDNVRIRADLGVVIDLDEDNDGSNSLLIRDGANANTFAINESGQVTLGEWTGTVIDDAYVSDTITASNYLPLTGGSLSGDLTMSGSVANIALGSNYLSGDGDDEGIYVDSSGRVGIGTNGPDLPLHVVASTSELVLRLEENTGGEYFDLRVSNNGNLTFVSDSGSSRLYLADAEDEVGINDSSPDANLEISANGDTGSAALMISSDDNDDGNLLTVLHSGSVGIGTSTPADLLHVDGDIRVGSGTTGCVKDADGTTISGTCSSDERLKDNIMPLSFSTKSYLEALVALTPSTYTWNERAATEFAYGTTETQTGLIAQQVAQSMPELIATSTDGFLQVRFSDLPIYLVQALKELWQRVVGLEEQLATIDALEARVSSLEAELGVSSPPEPEDDAVDPPPDEDPDPTPPPDDPPDTTATSSPPTNATSTASSTDPADDGTAATTTEDGTTEETAEPPAEAELSAEEPVEVVSGETGPETPPETAEETVPEPEPAQSEEPVPAAESTNEETEPESAPESTPEGE